MPRINGKRSENLQNLASKLEDNIACALKFQKKEMELSPQTLDMINEQRQKVETEGSEGETFAAKCKI